MALNFLPIFLAAVASMVAGALWYSQMLFGKKWMELMGIPPERAQQKPKGMAKLYATSFVLDIITALILTGVLGGAVVSGSFVELVVITVLVWLAFQVPVLAGSVMWESRSFKLFLLNAGHRLVSLVVMAAILGYFYL